MFLARFFSSLRLPSLLVPLILTFTTTSHSAYTTISTGAELKGFAEEVNSGTTYSGSTVTLAADIDLAGIDFTPIGTFVPGITGLDFRGVFDGNGYVIKNMNLTSSSLIYMGLFGYTFGCTIKDAVIDLSCSVTTHFIENDTYSYGYAGGIIGYTDTGTGVGETRIQNCVNMGTIKGTEANSVLGGIAGVHSATRFTSYIVNCVNLGEIVYSGTAAKAIVGGIVGWMTATYDGIFPSLANCVNLKTLTLTTQPTNAGAIVGFSDKDENVVQNNYWLEGTAAQGYTGLGTFSNNEAFDSDYKLSSTGASLVDSLNNYISSQSSSLGLRKAGTVTFNTNGGSSVSTRTSVLVMLGTPNTPTKTGYTFDGWYTDPGFNNQWASTTLFDGDGTLYARWNMNQYTVSFSTGCDTTIEPISSLYTSTIPLPPLTKAGYTLTSWTDDRGYTFINSYTINRAENVTLTAHWTPNNYTVTFNTNGGDSLSESERTKGVTYDQQYDDLPEPTRTGHSFNGWFAEEGGESVTSETIVATPNDHTLTAQWTINNYTVSFDFDNGTIVEKRTFAFNETIVYPENLTMEGYIFSGWDNNITEMPANNLTIKAQWSQIPTEFVEIVFGKKEMDEKEIRSFISEFIQDENYQIKIFNSESEGTTVILKFNDVEKADEFYRKMQSLSRESSAAQKVGQIKRIGYVDGNKDDFSPSLTFSFLYLLFVF